MDNTTQKSINIFSLNVRGLNNDRKRRTIMSWLYTNNCKIILFQETFCQTDITLGSDGQVVHNKTNSAHSRGVSTAFHSSLNVKIENIHKTDDARVLLINCNIEGVNTSLINVYASTDRKQRQELFKKLKYWIPRNADHPQNIIIGGDFNSTMIELIQIKMTTLLLTLKI